jgi:NAD(P)-dependent dehydrogenase (short-subunit alcohol dehydrogenase family)
MGTLDGKVAIVTGAGRGIGRGEALLLADQGAKVVVNDLGGAREGEGADKTPAQEVTDEIVKGGGEAVANYDDVASWPGAESLIGQAIETFGKVDILVNNAGILRDGMSFNLSEEDWDSVIRVHLKGHFAPSRFAAVYWREKAKGGEPVAGRIINTSSESGLFGNAGQSNYAAAKAGIASMTIVLARELQKYGVTVNAIAPRARTRLTETVVGADQLMAAKEGEFDAWHPDNMAPLIGFLAGDAAADVSGQVFVMWGDRVYLMRGWSLANELSADGKRWTVEDLIARKAELFAPVDNGSAIPSMAFSMS